MKMRKLLIALISVLGLTTSKAQNSSLDNPRFTVKTSYGYGTRVNAIYGGLSYEEKNYVRQIMNGSTFDLAAHVTFHKGMFGVGLKYNNFSSSGSNNFASGKDRITYIGPSFIFNTPDGKIGQLQVGASIGYIELEETFTRNDNNIKRITGNNLGIVLHTGYHFKINKYIYVGPDINLVAGTLTKSNIQFFDGRSQSLNLQDNPEGLTRVDFLVSAKFKI